MRLLIACRGQGPFYPDGIYDEGGRAVFDTVVRTKPHYLQILHKVTKNCYPQNEDIKPIKISAHFAVQSSRRRLVTASYSI